SCAARSKFRNSSASSWSWLIPGSSGCTLFSAEPRDEPRRAASSTPSTSWVAASSSTRRRESWRFHFDDYFYIDGDSSREFGHADCRARVATAHRDRGRGDWRAAPGQGDLGR